MFQWSIDWLIHSFIHTIFWFQSWSSPMRVLEWWNRILETFAPRCPLRLQLISCVLRWKSNLFPQHSDTWIQLNLSHEIFFRIFGAYSWHTTAAILRSSKRKWRWKKSEPLKNHSESRNKSQLILLWLFRKNKASSLEVGSITYSQNNGSNRNFKANWVWLYCDVWCWCLMFDVDCDCDIVLSHHCPSLSPCPSFMSFTLDVGSLRCLGSSQWPCDLSPWSQSMPDDVLWHDVADGQGVLALSCHLNGKLLSVKECGESNEWQTAW